MPSAASQVDQLAANGRYYFTTSEMRSVLGVSAAATRQALSRLARKREIASPARGFYVILPPEYRRLGCLPADQLVPALMKHLKQEYYAALLSAAQYHGAAHHRPQIFQVALRKKRRPISCGSVRISFIARKRLLEVPVQTINSPRGRVLVSTEEATAIDLVGYEKKIGGLDLVATILSELAERLNPMKLAEVARTAPIPWAQRLGYLLEYVGASDKALPLKEFVKLHARNTTLLQPDGRVNGTRVASDWRLRINARIETEA